MINKQNVIPVNTSYSFINKIFLKINNKHNLLKLSIII